VKIAKSKIRPHWSFGDNGAFCFFISPDDLAGRNWSAVRLTFECG